jgi:prepilin-type processing-associated H-X9-DG protein
MLPRNDGGAIYLFVDGLIFFLFSLNISHIFYKIPDKYGLVVKNA